MLAAADVEKPEQLVQTTAIRSSRPRTIGPHLLKTFVAMLMVNGICLRETV